MLQRGSEDIEEGQVLERESESSEEGPFKNPNEIKRSPHTTIKLILCADTVAPFFPSPR